MRPQRSKRSRREAALERLRAVAPLAGLDLEQVKYHAGKCRGKVDYRSEEEAARAIEENETKFGRPFETYRCPYCNLWHLTSHPWRETR